MPNPRPDIERVKWLDSGIAVSDGWMTPDHILDHTRNQIVLSVGFVMYEDEDRLILTGSYAPDIDQHLNAQGILKSAIMHRKVVTD